MVSLPVHGYGTNQILEGFRAGMRRRQLEDEKRRETYFNLAKVGKLNTSDPNFMKMGNAQQEMAKAMQAQYQQEQKARERERIRVLYDRYTKGYDEAEKRGASPEILSQFAKRADALEPTIYGSKIGLYGEITDAKTRKAKKEAVVQQSIETLVQQLNGDSTSEQKWNLKNFVVTMEKEKLFTEDMRKTYIDIINDVVKKADEEKNKRAEALKKQQDEQRKLDNTIKEKTQTQRTPFTLNNGKTIETTYSNALALEKAGKGKIGQKTELPRNNYDFQNKKDIAKAEESILKEPESPTAIAAANFYNKTANTPYVYVPKKTEKSFMGVGTGTKTQVEKLKLPKIGNKQVTLKSVRQTMEEEGMTFEDVLRFLGEQDPDFKEKISALGL